jgi:hypothetical protein
LKPPLAIITLEQAGNNGFSLVFISELLLDACTIGFLFSRRILEMTKAVPLNAATAFLLNERVA